MTTASNNASPFDIAIVGGGIAGLTLAVALLKQNVPVTVYEAAPQYGEIGAGVAFGPNAVRAMTLIDTRVKEAFERRATANQWKDKENFWFTCRVGDARRADSNGYTTKQTGQQVKVGDTLFDMPFTNNNSRGGVHRAHFLDEMVKLIPESVSRFGKKLVDITTAKDGSGDAVLHFADGTTAQHSAVIGCDGIKSRTREVLLGKDDPASRAVFSGKYAYRGLIPMDQASELLGEEKAANSQMYFGYHGHVLTFPIEKGKTMNVVAFSSRDTWDDPNWVVHTTKEEMLNDYEGWGETVLDIMKAMQKPDVWALFNHPPAKTYFRGRICLLGDAAHASTPHQGAGAGMCIEDAFILSALVADVKSLTDLEKAFEAYDAVRRPRTQKLVKTSREAGQLYDMELVGDDLDRLEDNMTNRMTWIWNEDIGQELEEAKKIMRGEKAKI